MSLAERLKSLKKEKEFQETIFGEPEPIEPEPIEPELIEVEEGDPRPDLPEDSELWARLLKLAARENSDLVAILHAFRCLGTRIRQGRSGYVLRPDVAPIWAWPSREEYEEERDRWLKPHRREITSLLKRL